MSKKKLNHLFITYDGLLDPLGKKSNITLHNINKKSSKKNKHFKF